jgi:hypothetical protein
MKNKSDPTLLQTSYRYNEIQKRTPKSHETIALSEKMMLVLSICKSSVDMLGRWLKIFKLSA